LELRDLFDWSEGYEAFAEILQSECDNPKHIRLPLLDTDSPRYPRLERQFRRYALREGCTFVLVGFMRMLVLLLVLLVVLVVLVERHCDAVIAAACRRLCVSARIEWVAVCALERLLVVAVVSTVWRARRMASSPPLLLVGWASCRSDPSSSAPPPPLLCGG
jgi:hypothetical protein